MCYKQSGIKPEDINVIELPDNTPWHELVYSELILKLEPGEGDRMLQRGDTQLGGEIPICPSGGISSFGEAVSAQGLQMACEIIWQLRGEAGERQVKDAKVGWAQSYGLLGNSGAAVFRRAF